MLFRALKILAMACASFWLAWVAYINIASRDAMDQLSEQAQEIVAEAQAGQRASEREERLADEGWGTSAAVSAAADGDGWGEDTPSE